MAYTQIPERGLFDYNYSRDINQLMENINVLEGMQTSYSPYYVQSSAPSGPYHGWLWYNTTTNKLYQYNGYKSDWVEIDWVTAIQATPEWQAGKLRINSGVLQITPNGSNWYDCYPALGAHAILLQNYSVKYFPLYNINIMCTGASATIIPIAFAKELSTAFEYRFLSYTADNRPEISFSGQSVNGIYEVIYHDSTGTYAFHSSGTVSTIVVGDYSRQSFGQLMIGPEHITNRFVSYGVKSGSYWCLFNGGWANLLSLYTNPYYIGTISWNTSGYLVWRKVL